MLKLPRHERHPGLTCVLHTRPALGNAQQCGGAMIARTSPSFNVPYPFATMQPCHRMRVGADAAYIISRQGGLCPPKTLHSADSPTVPCLLQSYCASGLKLHARQLTAIAQHATIQIRALCYADRCWRDVGACQKVAAGTRQRISVSFGLATTDDRQLSKPRAPCAICSIAQSRTEFRGHRSHHLPCPVNCGHPAALFYHS
jgi:hypothetical protein